MSCHEVDSSSVRLISAGARSFQSRTNNSAAKHWRFFCLVMVQASTGPDMRRAATQNIPWHVGPSRQDQSLRLHDLPDIDKHTGTDDEGVRTAWSPAHRIGDPRPLRLWATRWSTRTPASVPAQSGALAQYSYSQARLMPPRCSTTTSSLRRSPPDTHTCAMSSVS
uniref:Uncharacterized protein n=1 Tax=Mycobacterium leprae TaxID=1769 RepID=O32945_MYCLR|nr:hypothetical protein MLCB2052.33c [Mycobacterium leprae]